MEIYSLNSKTYSQKYQNNINNKRGVITKNLKSDIFDASYSLNKRPSFKGFLPLEKIKGYYKYVKTQKAADGLYEYVKYTKSENNFFLRNLSMEKLEGLQYGIDVFKDLSMKDIQYLSENLHVIVVKRGCNNMCGYCYADAKPQNREMSWEDFTKITRGFKELKKRLHNLDIFGENNPISQSDPIYKTTELFYDADCMDLAIKDKNGVVYDFTKLATEIYESLGRRTVFDTSGWYRKNPIKQARAEKYAEYFSKSENMDKLNAFNVSFNVFNSSYIASVKALKKGDKQKAKILRARFTDNMANTLFTFSPIIKNPKFGIMIRAFNPKAQNANYFDSNAMISLMQEVLKKLENLYKQDLNGPQRYVKTQADCLEKLNCIESKMSCIDTGLNSSGRMQHFMEEFNIKDNKMLYYDDSIQLVKDDIGKLGRYHKFIAHRLIDTDGKVYHMNYARFFPTEIQLNIEEKNIPSPQLANLDKNFIIDKKLLNSPENVRIETISVKR